MPKRIGHGSSKRSKSKGSSGKKRHRLSKLTASPPRGDPAPPRWPHYNGTSQYVGRSASGRVFVYVDPSLGQPGLQNARDLLNDADRIVQANDATFGTIGESVSVIVFAFDGHVDGSGGADHGGCDYATGAAIEVCASFGNSQRVSALFEAELSECSMGGDLCNVSTGEALSRWCAAHICHNALSDFATAPTWAQRGMQNFVDSTDPTDKNPVSVGCGMAFLSWLISQGHSLDNIARAMVSIGSGGTLSQVYARLAIDTVTNAWPKFIAAVRELPGGVVSDNPFATAPLLPLPQIAQRDMQAVRQDPQSIEFAERIFSHLVRDISAGKTPKEMAQGLKLVLAVEEAAAGSPQTGCSKRSRRLRPPTRSQLDLT